MKKISYSQDVDALLIELSSDPNRTGRCTGLVKLDGGNVLHLLMASLTPIPQIHDG